MAPALPASCTPAGAVSSWPAGSFASTVTSSSGAVASAYPGGVATTVMPSSSIAVVGSQALASNVASLQQAGCAAVAPSPPPMPSTATAAPGAITAAEGKSQGASGHMAAVTMLDPTEQDSDLMERMTDGAFTGSAATGAVQLISLGCSCGPKLTFKDVGRGAETLPFDWARTSVEALLHFISRDFQGFFDTTDRVQFTDERGSEWTTFRSAIHSFWHDDPTHPAMRERYMRRINRFLSIDAQTKPVLFVRSVAQTSEILRTAELVNLLVRKFGRGVRLLLMVDFQGSGAAGPCMVSGLDEHLLLWFFDTKSAPSLNAPYAKPLATALNWCIGEPISVGRLRDLNEAHALASPNTWGMYGAAGVPAFTSVQSRC